MAGFEKFNFKNLKDIQNKINELGANMILSEDFSPLKKPVKVGHKTAPNAMAVLPMEGCDGNPDGSPSELTLRRYKRFAGGGAGLLWYEACAVVMEGRANPLQLHINKNNVETFKSMVQECNAVAMERNHHRPISILQLTHSGRYSRPVDKAAPMIAQHDPLLDPRVGIDESYPVVTDEYLDALQDKYVEAAVLAEQAGFDGVDMKACHRYLISEILASHTRKGKYGGSFENRSRFILETIAKIKAATGDNFIVAARFNVFDSHPYPYGFGVDKNDCWKPDLTEPLELVRLMIEAGVELLSNSAGNPYYRFPQVTRPFDTPTLGGETPDEHPIESIARLFDFTRQIQKVAGNIPVVGNGYSWLRQFIPYAGAANLADGSASIVGLGRESFAYPDAPYDILNAGEMDFKKCCIACSKCTQIMRDHGKTGCVIRDSALYVPLYNEARESAQLGH
ncbi:NADH:flavin oxidoreductase [Oscillospiraceae bacterium PP1C4]